MFRFRLDERMDWDLMAHYFAGHLTLAVGCSACGLGSLPAVSAARTLTMRLT
jgi:hypothetical protein